MMHRMDTYRHNDEPSVERAELEIGFERAQRVLSAASLSGELALGDILSSVERIALEKSMDQEVERSLLIEHPDLPASLAMGPTTTEVRFHRAPPVSIPTELLTEWIQSVEQQC